MIRWTGVRQADQLVELQSNLRQIPICPDLLDYDDIGAADNWRGRVVRAFFWLLRIWPV